MAVQPILSYPDVRLSTPCEPVTDQERESPEFFERMHDLADTLASSGGLGLSAPQIGWMRRVLVLSDRQDVERLRGARGEVRCYTLLNPRIVATRGPSVNRREGCLSFTDVRGMAVYELMPMFENCDVTWTDPSGAPGQATFKDLDARVIQHECEHLSGRTFLARMGNLQRRLFLKKLSKAQRRRPESRARA